MTDSHGWRHPGPLLSNAKIQSNAIAHLSSSPAPGREDLERLDFDEPNKDSHIAMQP